MGSSLHQIPTVISHIHMIAICGTGMGSLAGLLKDQGFYVTGSDENVYPPMSSTLEQMGIKTTRGYHPANLTRRPDLIIVGNAVSKANPEVAEMLRLNIPYVSMPQALSHFFLGEKKAIVVAGTHGKTTTSALISHLLRELGSDPSFLIGGIFQENRNDSAPQKNYRNGKGEYFVVEGDEYDTAFFDKGPKFLHYRPYHTLITSVEFDHADIFKDLDHVAQAFESLTLKVNPQGSLLGCCDYPLVLSLLKKAVCPTETYGWHGTSDWRGRALTEKGLHTVFDIFWKNRRETRIFSPLMGHHNALNVLAAFALMRRLGYDAKNIQEGLSTFPGVKRRQEILGIVNDIIVMDDFAHHPTAVSETIRAVRKRYPERGLWAIFEPRSNTSKRDTFQNEFAHAFEGAQQVILADVFMPEKVGSGKILDVERLASDIHSQGIPARHLSGIDTIVDYVASNIPRRSVVLVMSNGGFGGIHKKMMTKLQIKN